MRRPRDFDAELRALADKARALKDRRIRQLGELVLATGADTIDADILAGVLLAATETKDAATKETWRKRGAGWFTNAGRDAAQEPRSQPQGALPLFGGAPSDQSGEGAD